VMTEHAIEPCDQYGWEAIEVLRRLVASDLPHGHQFRPISEDNLPVIEAANASREEQWSVRCWDCSSTGDNPISPSSDRTWGDEWHEQFEAFKEARELLNEIDASCRSKTDT
jgi:hypothetical protein